MSADSWPRTQIGARPPTPQRVDPPARPAGSPTAGRVPFFPPCNDPSPARLAGARQWPCTARHRSYCECCGAMVPVQASSGPAGGLSANPVCCNDNGARGRPLSVSAEAILETEDLTKEFAGFVAVNGVGLRVARGTIPALIGADGG